MVNHIVYLSIGSNLGDKIKNLKDAVDLLVNNLKISLVSASDIYQTEPVGGVPQDDFYNQAIRIETSLTARQLLEYIHKIESSLGRIRPVHWGPRSIDLDILFYDDQEIQQDDLIIPHPEISNRRFVLVPLLQVVEEDGLKNKIQQMLDDTSDRNRVDKIKQ
jgi:2-amino-4-hydroxy-6-hydroxymethyldihydropteridine diphosphokinase